jgi:hypothetical protein
MAAPLLPGTPCLSGTGLNVRTNIHSLQNPAAGQPLLAELQALEAVPTGWNSKYTSPCGSAAGCNGKHFIYAYRKDSSHLYDMRNPCPPHLLHSPGHPQHPTCNRIYRSFPIPHSPGNRSWAATFPLSPPPSPA